MLTALLLGVLTTFANLLGSSLSASKVQPSPAVMASALAFSGGFLLAAALLSMVPAAIEGSSVAPAMIGAGFLLVYFTEHLGNVHVHQLPVDDGPGHAHAASGAAPPGTAPASSERRRAIAAFAAFNVHDLMDGIAIGAAMITDPAIGTVVFLAVLLHEVPAGFAIGAIIRSHGGSRLQALLAGLSIGVVTLVGILIPFAMGEVSADFTSVLLGLAAGTFVYLGASILIPTAETGRYRWSFIYVALGFGVFAVTESVAERFVGA